MPRRKQPITVAESCAAFQAQHEASAARRQALRAMLAKACAVLRRLAVAGVCPIELIRAHRVGMPALDQPACRVVICDDTPGIRMLLSAMLSAQPGVDVVGEARNGREAIEVARKFLPDVMLLDISMPVMDGIEALPQILVASPATRILMLSGFSAPEIKQRAMGEGAAAFLEKGVDFGQIIAAVRDHCHDGSDA